jgi:hypothetical protein
MPLVCLRCRKIIRSWKRSKKWLVRDDYSSEAEYEARLKADIPEHYFRRFSSPDRDI